MTDTEIERPLVTFALFAYNQEHCIREAIEGAFSQTYEPLEIILSDDCSADRTFEIMQEMAAEYKGPHRVMARKNPQNVGTIDHLLAVARASSGGLIVVAAGDDVSFPHRTACLVTQWLSTDADALYSGCRMIGEAGEIVNAHHQPAPLPAIQELFAGITSVRRHQGLVRNIPGYSAAYARSVLIKLPDNGNRSLNEDALTTIIINMNHGFIDEIKEPLLSYRVPTTCMGNSPEELIIVENRAARFSKSSEKFYPYLIDIINSMNINSKEAAILCDRLRSMLRMSTLHAEIWERDIFGRITLLPLCRTRKELSLVLARIAGQQAFAQCKSMARRFRLAR